MLDQDLNNNLPGQSHSTTPGPPAMRERGSWWPAGWYPDNWFSSSSSHPLSPPRTGGTGRRIRKASGPSSPDLNRFSSSPNMFCTVNCRPRPSTSRGQLSMPISQYTFYNLHATTPSVIHYLAQGISYPPKFITGAYSCMAGLCSSIKHKYCLILFTQKS